MADLEQLAIACSLHVVSHAFTSVTKAWAPNRVVDVVFRVSSEAPVKSLEN